MERSKVVRNGITIGLVGALALALGGCANVAKEKYDAAIHENSELRDRNTQLEQTSRDKDLRIADLETRNQNQANTTVIASPVGGGGAAYTPVAPGNPNAGDDFRNVGGRMVAEISGDVLFDSGKATLKSTSKKQLDRIASQLNGKYSGTNVRIEGHTDSDPIKKSQWASNDALSQARADSVRTYLATKGVTDGRLQSIGMGSKYPKSSKAASRRVDIVILSN